jgi:hypothetical protein
MDFDFGGINPGDYVQRGSPEDRFQGGPAAIISCRYCGRALFARPEEEPDCGMHLN